jgi:hypothetical protein
MMGIGTLGMVRGSKGGFPGFSVTRQDQLKGTYYKSVKCFSIRRSQLDTRSFERQV